MNASEQRIKHHLEQLAQFTATPGQGTTRMSYSQQDKQARDYLKTEMQKIGLQVREDAIGNIIGHLAGSETNLPPVMIGSHFDSVPNGGAFDGPAGIVMALEVATRFQQQNLKPRYPIEVVALVEEEGASFGNGLLASRAMAGKVSTFDLENMFDDQGISAAQRMNDAGFNANNVASVIRKPGDLKAFIELHIEQGPILEQAGEDVGLVDVIVGISQLTVTIQGKAGHAGTTPMTHRADALLAASKVIQHIPQFALNAGEATVATVGKLHVLPNGANVIPNKVIFTVDVRSKNETKLLLVLEQIKTAVKSLDDDGITTTVEQPLYVKPTELNSTIHQLLQENSQKLGLKSRTMVSGAGHDAMIFAGFTDVGLVFVPSRNGLSHHPDEWTDYAQIEKGVDVIVETIKQLTEAESYFINKITE